MSKHHRDKMSGLNKWHQLKNRHELYDADYVDQLSEDEKLLA